LCLCYKSATVILLLIAEIMRKLIITLILWLEGSDTPPLLLVIANLIGIHGGMSQRSEGTNSTENIKNQIYVWWCWW
jgi:hypothetical protein